MSEQRATCTDHCTRCQCHFHGLGAFDLHQRAGECLDPASVLYGPDSKRSGEARLQAYTLDGWCNEQPRHWREGKNVGWEHPVTIWQVATTEEQRQRMREAFA